MKPVKPHCPLLIIALATFTIKVQNSINSLMIRAETNKTLYVSSEHCIPPGFYKIKFYRREKVGSIDSIRKNNKIYTAYVLFSYM